MMRHQRCHHHHHHPLPPPVFHPPPSTTHYYRHYLHSPRFSNILLFLFTILLPFLTILFLLSIIIITTIGTTISCLKQIGDRLRETDEQRDIQAHNYVTN